MRPWPVAIAGVSEAEATHTERLWPVVIPDPATRLHLLAACGRFWAELFWALAVPGVGHSLCCMVMAGGAAPSQRGSVLGGPGSGC